MTYLHQLRAHFTGHQLEVQQIGKTADESNYIIGKFNTDNDTDITKQVFGQEIINLRKLKQTKKQENDNETIVKNINVEPKNDPSKLRLPLKFTAEPDIKQDNNDKAVKGTKTFFLNGSKLATKVRKCYDIFTQKFTINYCIKMLNISAPFDSL